MDLGHDGGRVSVRVRAWLEAGDTLQAQASGPTSYDVAVWPQTGWQEVTLHLDNCRDNDDLTLWSGVGRAFMLDWVEVSQQLQAGDRVALHTAAVTADDSSARSAVVDNISRWGDYTYAYEVTAWRRHQVRAGDMVCSDVSNRVAVPLPVANGVEANRSDAEAARVIDRLLHLDLTDETWVRLYAADGRLADAWTAPAGHSVRTLPAGVYVHTLHGRALKFVL